MDPTNAITAPLFILASPRSFTSLVCAMIGQHEGAYGLPEVNLMAADTVEELLTTSAGPRQFVVHGLIRAVAQLYAGEQTIQSAAMGRRWLQKRRAMSTGTVYRELCRKVAPLRLVDKSPSYSRRADSMQRIEREFPEARYLHLTRNPRDQGASMMRAVEGVAELLVARSLDYSTRPPSIDPQYEWHRTQGRILTFLKAIPEQRQFHLRGEDLLLEPRGQLEKICAWLGLEWSEAALERMMHPEDSPYACMGPYGAQWGNNPGFQRSPVFRPAKEPPGRIDQPLPWRKDDRRLLPEVMELARSLGYA
jgi:hypothetical protein